MASSTSGDNEVTYVDRDHTWGRYIFFSVGLSLCIFVDIFQYSMPLAFLPSVLEDRGHTAMEIATAIGIYYWTGFLGGVVLTSYQIWRVLYKKEDECNDVTPYSTVQRHIKFLIVGLAIGTVTLFIQAVQPRWSVHTACRFVQGFVGAYIFFYAFLLSVALFKGQQQVVAMSLASCATCIAEVFGSFLGAVLYDLYGQRAVFWFLGFISVANQAYLFAILYLVRTGETSKSPPPSQFSSPLSSPSPPVRDADVAVPTGQMERSWRTLTTPQPGAIAKLKTLMQSRQFTCANLLITMAAVIKGSVEEMLPFYGDHQWGYDPLQIGKLFCIIAIFYMLAAAFVCRFWTWLGRSQIGCSSCWLLLLGVSAWLSFSVARYFMDTRYLIATLAGYGLCSGLVFTAAAQLIADVIEREEGSCKEAANGIWNVVWEAGGSIGFLLGGLLAERYNDQMSLLMRYVFCSVVVAICMVAVAFWPVAGVPHGKPRKLVDKVDNTLDYGSVA